MTDPVEIERILDEANVIFVAFRDEPAPYVVPLFFGHEGGKLYVHSALAGTKIQLLRADQRVGFSAAAQAEVVEGKTACSFTARTRSVAGTGIARVVEDQKERLHGLDLIMRHYAGRDGAFAYDPASLARTLVIAIDIASIMGRGTGIRPE